MDRSKKQIAEILDKAGVARQSRGRVYLAAFLALLVGSGQRAPTDMDGAGREMDKCEIGLGEVCNE